MTGTERDLAWSDCEHCRDGWISQPANCVSSLAYVVAGAALLRRPSPVRGRAVADRALAWSLVASTGVGSVAYHGPGGRLAHWAHDASLIAMLGVSAVTGVAEQAGRRPPTGALAVVPIIAGLAAVRPAVSGVAQAAGGVTVAGIEAGRVTRSRAAGPRTAVWGAALAAYGLGGSESPACRPGSLLQPHAAWHVLSAAAFWLGARSR